MDKPIDEFMMRVPTDSFEQSDGKLHNINSMKRFWSLGVFFYVLACGVFVQFVLLPYLLPDLNVGGLIKDSDALDFHNLAVKQAIAIRLQGWSAWMFRPAGQSTIGLTAAVYALTGFFQPWVMLPMNALLWASSTWMLLLILEPFTRSTTRSVVSTLPFLMAPSALLFLTQIHKDPFIIAGTLALWLALTRLVSSRNSALSWRGAATHLTWILGGTILLWIGRPYLMFLSLLSYFIIGIVLFFADWVQKRFNGTVWVVFIISALICFGLVTTKDTKGYARTGTTGFGKAIVFRTSCLGPLDAPFRRMATMRQNYLNAYPTASTKLDADVPLDSSWAVMSYAPRAVHLLWAPFPSQWMRSASSSPFAILVDLETMLRYLLLPGLIWLCWNSRRSLAFWTPWLFFLPWSIIYTITVPNLGTLIRVRFSFVMLLASFGAAGTFMLWDAWRKKDSGE